MHTFKKLSFFLALVFVLSIAFTIQVAAAETWTSNKIGSVNGYDYEFWKDAGNGSMTINGTSSNASFSCEWSKTSGTNNFLARSGKKLGASQTYSQYGNISLNYAVSTYQPSGTSYLAVYGWTKDPMVEWYIVENWNNYNPSSGASRVGSITVDGGSYDILKTTRTNKPGLNSNSDTFEQYWSVRTSKRTSGTVNVAEHFKAWEKAGFKMTGKLYEVSFVVEGYDGSGKANVQTMQLTMGGSSNNNPPSTTANNNNNGGNTTGTPQNCRNGHPKAYYNADGHNCSKNCGALDWENHSYTNNVCTGCGHNRGGSSTPAQTTTTTRAPAATQAPSTTQAANNGSGARYTFSNLTFQQNLGVSSYSVSNGSLNVNYGGQYKEVRYNLPSSINLANCSSIVINGSSTGQTAFKFFNSSGTEVITWYNNKSSSATNWTKTLSASEKNNTITRIGVMSQDTGTSSAVINSITFNGVSGGTTTTQAPAQTAATTTTRAPAATQAPATTTAAANNSSGNLVYNFGNMSLNKNAGASSYSVSNGTLTVNYGGQYKEVIYNFPSNVNLSSYSAIVVNGTCPNGNTAFKFYDANGKEVFVMWNNKSSSATNFTLNLSAAQKNNTIRSIGIMSQDTGSYSAYIGQVTFRK
ncbi:MAG: glycoside hydrolase family 11 protein [Oscillospiraceae bacterium]|nr:glycoside hydrolase family 11 protein [Oscillospiraceae bacterium]